jgi:hypothetical protein
LFSNPTDPLDWRVSLRRSLNLDDPQKGVAVALTRPAHRAEPIRHRVLKSDGALAALVGLGHFSAAHVIGTP